MCLNIKKQKLSNIHCLNEKKKLIFVTKKTKEINCFNKHDIDILMKLHKEKERERERERNNNSTHHFA